MLQPPPGIRVFLACGSTDMRKGFDGLAAQVQMVLPQDPHGGALFAFRGRRGDLIKLLWWDGHPLRLPSVQDCLDDVRRQQRQSQQARDVGRVDLLGCGQFIDRAVAARLHQARDVALVLIREGLARPYHGERRRSWCG